MIRSREEIFRGGNFLPSYQFFTEVNSPVVKFLEGLNLIKQVHLTKINAETFGDRPFNDPLFKANNYLR